MENILSMKNILSKIDINVSTLLFILLYFFCGYIKDIIIIYFIIFFHELGHVFMSLLFKRKILKITLYPFGGITKTNSYLNSSMKEDFYIYIGGILFQIVLELIVVLLYYNQIIDFDLITKIYMYNHSMILFNLLPIIPLDGYLLFNLLFNKYLAYYKSLYFSFFLSILILIWFTLKNYDNYIIISFLIYNSTIYLKNIGFLYNRFILERYLYDFNYKKILYYNYDNLKALRKNCFCYFKKNNRYQSEKKILMKKFDNYNIFW